MLRHRSSILPLSLLLLTGACSVATSAPPSSPVAYWAMQPVGPDETALVAAGNIDGTTTVEVARLADGDPTQASKGIEDIQWTEVKPEAVSSASILFVIPKDWKPGIYAYRLKKENEISETKFINLPDIYFVAGDRGDFATPGGWFQVHGTALSIPGSEGSRPPALALRSGGKTIATLRPDAGASMNTGFRQRFPIPNDLPAGPYELAFHNGCGGIQGWVDYRNLTFDGRPIASMEVRNSWEPEETISVEIRPGDDAQAKIAEALTVAANRGGATVQLPEGAFALGKPLILPNHTVLRGAGKDKTILTWEEKMVGNAKPDELDSGIEGAMLSKTEGATFGIADLSIVMSSDFNPAIGMRRSTGGSFVTRTKIELPNVHTAEEMQAASEKRPWGYSSCLPGIWLYECANVVINDNTIRASTPVHPHASSSTRLEKNTLLWRHYLSHMNARCERLIFEDNRFLFQGLLAQGVITPGWEPRLYFTARFQNQRDVYMGFNSSESEIPQNAGFNGFFGHDTSGGGYIGPVLAADEKTGTVTLPTSLRSISAGSLVQILDGKGAGQFRYAARRPERDSPAIPVLEPWDITPDATSVVVLRNTQGRFLVVDNDVPFDGRWSNYFTSHDVVVARNKLGAASPDGKGRGLMNYEFVGFTSAAGRSIGGFTTMLRNQVIDNLIVRRGFTNTGNYPIKEPPYPGYNGPSLTYVVYRNNRPDDPLPASFMFSLPLQQGEGIVFEGNQGLHRLKANAGTWGKPTVGVFRKNTAKGGGKLSVEYPKDYQETSATFLSAQ